MDLLPIQLGIARPAPKKRKVGGSPSSGNAPPQDMNKAEKQKIFERDDHTCRCCGFRSIKFQDVHFIDHDKTNRADNNLATVCTFCHQCFNLQDVNQQKSGALLWLPEIPQYQLNHIARSIYIARISQGGIAEVARKTLDTLMARRLEVQSRLSTDDPNILAMVLGDYLPYGHYAARDERLKGVRLFPLERRIKREKGGMEFNQFPQMLAYWRSKDGPYGGKVPQKWVSLYQNMKHAA